MKVMSKKEQDLYARLIELAGGDFLVLEKAILESARNGTAKYSDIVQFIEKSKETVTNAAA